MFWNIAAGKPGKELTMAIRPYTGPGGKYRAYFKWQGKIYSKIVNTKTDGKAWEVETKKQLRQQEGMESVLMFSVASDKYLSDCEARMQPGTVREKFKHLTEFAAFMMEKQGGGDFPAAGVTVAHGKAFVASIREIHGNKSANRRLRTLKALWNWCREELPANPFRSIPMYPEDGFTKYVPPPADMEKVMAAAAAWERRILVFLLSTGARIGEMFHLTWEDVNLERNTLLLWTRKRKGGSRQSRLMPIAPRLRMMLEQLAESREAGKEHVFINPATGGPYNKLQPSVRYMLKRLCKAATVKEFGFHALRHYVAARLAQSQQANLVEIQQFLGHQRTTTTDLYLRSMSSGISHLAAIIDNLLPEQEKGE
jgi:integrase